MAIIIPSKNIYKKQNPKVLDNSIERIEIGAVEVVPDNDYNATVYNEDIDVSEKFNAWEEDFKYKGGERSYTYYGVGSAVGIHPSYNKVGIDITIPKSKNNRSISKLFTGWDSDKDEPNIKYSIEYEKYSGTCSVVGNITFEKEVSIQSKSFSVNETYDEASVGEIPKEVENLVDINLWSPSYEKVTASKSPEDKTNLFDNSIITETNEAWVFTGISIWCGVEIYKADFKWVQGSSNPSYTVGSWEEFSENNKIYPTQKIKLVGTYEYYKPRRISFTFYGNIIGIDLKDKTIYINGETQKKVHSIDGNELMQTGNYIDTTSTKAIETMYATTQEKYKVGKETATILCSISDYYDSETNEKVIAIDNSTNKMTFDISDEVVVFTHNNTVINTPMSMYKNGYQKEFETLGVKPKYDGAVWQELTLQEISIDEDKKKNWTLSDLSGKKLSEINEQIKYL